MYASSRFKKNDEQLWPELIRELKVAFFFLSYIVNQRTFMQYMSRHLRFHQPGKCRDHHYYFDACCLVIKGAVSRYSVIFCASSFLREEKMATAHASVADIRPWQLGQPREQLHYPSWVEKMSFSAALPCGRHYFSPHKMAAKITNYRDTAALKFERTLPYFYSGQVLPLPVSVQVLAPACLLLLRTSSDSPEKFPLLQN